MSESSLIYEKTSFFEKNAKSYTNELSFTPHPQLLSYFKYIYEVH